MNLGGPPAAAGTVHLVGAGPGDPSLLTLRAARLLDTCSFVAADALTPPALLDLAPRAAVRVDVGKRARRPRPAQEDINRLLVEAAADGHAVVRLKGGDPFVFGRGGEEALACIAAGVPFEVVPGISSAIAAPAAAGIPVTHRGVATGFAVITAHEDPTKPESQIDWAAVAAFPGTLVILMGLGTIDATVGRLLAHGRSATTPSAVVSWATTARQQVVEAPLARLGPAVRRSGIAAPATIVIGDVVALREVLAATPALVGVA